MLFNLHANNLDNTWIFAPRNRGLAPPPFPELDLKRTVVDRVSRSISDERIDSTFRAGGTPPAGIGTGNPISVRPMLFSGVRCNIRTVKLHRRHDIPVTHAHASLAPAQLLLVVGSVFVSSDTSLFRIDLIFHAFDFLPNPTTFWVVSLAVFWVT